MALIPIFTLYDHLGLCRHRLRARPLPHRVRAAVRDLPAAELLHRDPEGPAGGGPDRRRLRDPDLRPPDPAARAARDRLARDLPVPLDVERPASSRSPSAGTPSRSRSRSSRQLRQFGANIDLIAPASFISLSIPLVVFFAFQRYFVQGLLAGSVEVKWSRRDRRLGPGGVRRLPDAPARRGRARRDRSLRNRTRTRRRPGGCGRRRSGSGGCAPRATAIACRPRSPGSRSRRAWRRSLARSLVASVSTATTRPSTSSSRMSPTCATRSGWDESWSACAAIERVAAVDGGFSWTGTGVFRHVLLAPGHPGLNVPDELRGDPRVVHAYEPHGYAAAVDGRRRRSRRRDRVAECSRGRLGGRLGAPPRAGAAAAERAARTTSRAAGSRLTTGSRRGERVVRLRQLLAPSYPPGAQFDEPLARAAARGPLPGRAGPERRGAGHLRDRVPARFPAATRCSRGSSTSTASRPPDRGSCSTPTRRCRR